MFLENETNTTIASKTGYLEQQTLTFATASILFVERIDPANPDAPGDIVTLTAPRNDCKLKQLASNVISPPPVGMSIQETLNHQSAALYWYFLRLSRAFHFCIYL